MAKTTNRDIKSHAPVDASDFSEAESEVVTENNRNSRSFVRISRIRLTIVAENLGTNRILHLKCAYMFNKFQTFYFLIKFAISGHKGKTNFTCQCRIESIVNRDFVLESHRY